MKKLPTLVAPARYANRDNTPGDYAVIDPIRPIVDFRIVETTAPKTFQRSYSVMQYATGDHFVTFDGLTRIYGYRELIDESDNDDATERALQNLVGEATRMLVEYRARKVKS